MKQQRTTFEDVAELYASVRPEVPAPAVDALWKYLGIQAGDGVLEIGCGTGQLTKHLAARGAQVTAIDPGKRLLAACAKALAGYEVELIESTFEAWRPEGRSYDALTACQAAHWIEPEIFLDGAAAALCAGGRLGLLWHMDTSSESAFYKATQPLYDHYLPDAKSKPPQTLPLLVAAYETLLADDARFRTVPTQRWPWSRAFDQESYARMLRTHSPVNMLDEADREAFIEGHVRLIADFGGRITRTYETVLLGATLD